MVSLVGRLVGVDVRGWRRAFLRKREKVRGEKRRKGGKKDGGGGKKKRKNMLD